MYAVQKISYVCTHTHTCSVISIAIDVICSELANFTWLISIASYTISNTSLCIPDCIASYRDLQETANMIVPHKKRLAIRSTS